MEWANQNHQDPAQKMDASVQAPPRLLLGAALLFWGAMTSHALLGLIVALLVEGANWIRFRWDFNSTACSRAWKVSMVLILIVGTLTWLDGDRYTALPRLMIWLPLLLLPMMFVQSYGLRDWMPLNSFSFFAKLHRARNLRQGLTASVIRFNFGNLYFIAIMISAALGIYADQAVFLVGLVGLSAWLVFSRVKIRLYAFLAIVICAGSIGLGGQIGMKKLYRWATDRSLEGGYPSTSPTVNKTSIGSLGEIKQSPEMLWRLKPLEGTAPPQLLRLATYNRYRGINWRNDLPAPIPQDDKNFRELTTIELVDGEPHYLLREKMTQIDIQKPLPVFRIRGASRSEAPLPLPGNAASLQDFELDGIEVNPLGTVRVFPKKAIIDGTVRWRDDSEPEFPPWPTEDLAIDSIEGATIRQVAETLGLKNLPTTQAKIARLRQWFTQDFQYTRYLTIDRAIARNSPIGFFLTQTKRGHCEYFATATALLLRAVDVPTRYCVGFAVMEKDFRRNEYVIRGGHGHAWVRVWDQENGNWIDFDPTPSEWLGIETGAGEKTPWLADSYQRFKEDFFLWRNQASNRIAATAVMWVAGLSVFAFIAKRLWKSKLIVEEKKRAIYSNSPVARTPLHQLEARAQKILGPRPTGTPYAEWIASLPTDSVSQNDLIEAVDLHQRLRFDPQPTSQPDQSRLDALAGTISKRLRHTRSTRSAS